MSDQPLHDPADDEELAALLALDALDGSERSRAERQVGGFPAGWAEVVAALGDSVAISPPHDLRARTVARALNRRGSGRPVDAVSPCSPLDAYRRTAADLFALLGELTERDWQRQAHPRIGRVHDVVAHLFGVEELVLGWVGARSATDSATVRDHIEATRPRIDQFASSDPRLVGERWHSLSLQVAAACRAADPDLQLLAHDLPTDLDGLLVLRSFELWAHTVDICRATGQPLRQPDPSRLALMSSRLMAALPWALALRGATTPGRTARIVLAGDADTARAGGTYDVPLDPASAPGRPDTLVVADVIDLCLVAARRLAPHALHATIEGDVHLAETLLDAADAFASD
jgi:uncharacterized protein (TIGR03083 family)